MAQKTPNYNLNKPGYEDFGDVDTLNENFEKIDKVLAATDPTKVTAKAEPADADGMMIADSADGGKAKRLLWSSVKTALGKLFVPLARKINGKALSADVTLTAENVGAAAADRNCDYNFTNTGLNSVNIDTEFKFNYVTAISEDGHGSRPIGSWFTVVNYYATHFIRQVATTCNPVVNVGTNVATRVFERYRWQGDTQWSDWVELITKDNIGAVSELTSVEKTPSVNNQIAWQYG